MDHIVPSPDSTDLYDPSPPDGGPPKKKQKRNKPTLSCEECVERKTKVSVMFGRPMIKIGVLDAIKYTDVI